MSPWPVAICTGTTLPICKVLSQTSSCLHCFLAAQARGLSLFPCIMGVLVTRRSYLHPDIPIKGDKSNISDTQCLAPGSVC